MSQCKSLPAVNCCIFLVCFVLTLQAVCTAAEPEDYSGLAISRVEVAGNISIETSAALSRIRARAGDEFDADEAADDVDRLAKMPGVEYSYYNAQAVDGEVVLTFVIVEKNIIRSIQFKGGKKIKSGKLTRKLGYKVGDYLDPAMVRDGVETLKQYYLEKGYPFVEAELDESRLSYGELIFMIQPGPRVRINSVKFSGNNTAADSDLKKVAKTSKRKWLILPAWFVREKVLNDEDRLQDAYYNRGHLNARVKAVIKFTQDKRAAEITYVIEEGPKYHVEQVAVDGNQFFELQQLTEMLQMSRGETYSRRQSDSDLEQLRKLYHEKGFINAEIDRSVEFTAGNAVTVRYDISEGSRFRIGEVVITGNNQTQDKVLRRVLDEYDFKPGQWYNGHLAQGNGTGYLEKYLRQSTLLESVIITPQGDADDHRDAHLSLTEGQTGSVMLGAGVASDSGIIGQLVFEQRNFDITDTPESFHEFITGQAFKGAGQSLRIAAEPGTELSRYSIDFTEPYLMNRPVSLNVSGSSFERARESYDEGRMKGGVSFEKRYKNRWRRSIGFRVENVDVSDLENDAPREIRDIKGDNNLIGVKIGAGRDMTNDKFLPSEGYSFNLSYEQVGGDHSFGIASGTYRMYRTLKTDMAERKTIFSGKFHAASTVGDAPAFEKFYAGGSSSIRGFEYRGVSTRGLQTNTVNPKREDPVGSDWLALISSEVAVPMVGENLSLLFFADAGAIDSGSYRASIGTGLQIMIPQWFGPVPMKFEIAAPVIKEDEDEEQVFSFSVGRLF